MTWADSDVPNRGVDGYSRPRRACYPQGNLFDGLDPHQKGYQGSLSPTFVPVSHALRDTINPAFVFNPFRQISDLPKPSFGRPCFLIEGVPPQSNYPPAAVPNGLVKRRTLSGVALSHPRPPKRPLRRSHLRYAMHFESQQQAVVKLHGVFVSPCESPAYSPSSEFTRSQVGTPGVSLRPSCKPPIKRRGITLP